MRSCLIEVHHIRFKDTLELSLMKDQQVVQTFLPHTPQEALTDCIGSGSMIRRFEYLNAARCCHSSEDVTLSYLHLQVVEARSIVLTMAIF